MVKVNAEKPFQTRVQGNLVQVWDGSPDDNESELVMAIDMSLVPKLIHTLAPFVPKAEFMAGVKSRRRS